MESDTARLIADMARLYYLKDVPKTDIARQFGISRFKVARLLEQGRDAGIIRIEILGDGAQLDQLSADLAAHLGLASCQVVATGRDQTETRDRVARATAAEIRALLSPGDTVGFSWGRTMLAVSRHLADLPPAAVIQLTGTVGEDLTQSPLEILRSIAGASRVSTHPLFAPLFVASAESAAALRSDPMIAAALSRFAQLKLAVMSVGSWQPEITQLRSYLTAEDVALFDSVPAQAELLGIFLDRDGQEIPSGLAERRIAASVGDLLDTPHVLAAAGERAKVPAILAAVRSGLITQLITDQESATDLLGLPAVTSTALHRTPEEPVGTSVGQG